MQHSSLKRSLAFVATIALFAGLLLLTRPNVDPTPEVKAQTPIANATGWFMYGGDATRNMINAKAKNLPVEWSIEEGEEKNILWSADLGSKAYGGPIVANGKVIIGTNNQNKKLAKTFDDKGRPLDMGVLLCFDQKNGKFLWQQTFPKLAAGRVVDWPLEGICSTPFAEGDKIWYTNNRCEVICAKIDDGTPIWKVDMMKDLGVFPHNLTVCSPLIVDNDLFIITANGVDEGHINVPAPKAPSFLRMNKNDGKVLWQDNTPTVALTQINKEGDQESFFKRLVNRGDLIQHGQWSNPAYAVVNGQEQVIFPGGNGWIYSYTRDGKLIWKFDCNPKDAEYELGGKGTRNDFIATPVIYKNRVYIGVGQDPEHEKGVGHLWCIDMTKKGDVSPELVTDGKVWPPKTEKNSNSAMVWHYGGLKKVERGRPFDFGRTMSTCAIKDDLLYVAELEGYLHCLDTETGKVHWVHDTKSPIWSSPYIADNKVYLGVDADVVFVFEHSKKKNLLAENEMGSRCRATPVAVGDVLYVMTENKLYAIGEKK